MSRIITTLRIMFACAVLLLASDNHVAAQGYYDDAYGNSGSYQQFYDELSPYGQWVDDPQYGYVWVPDAGDDFRPYYSNGYWVNSDYGNTWVSNYRWGWAPFHYGRWNYSNNYGWSWIPGNVWGPAWVSWRSGGGCYGWAPMGPGVSVSMSFGNGWNAPSAWWNFAPQQYILTPGFQQHCYGPRYNQRYVQQTTIINNTYVSNNNTYISGPRRPDMERAIGRRVAPVTINNSRRPGEHELRGNNLSVYRPTIAQNSAATSRRPRQFATARQPINEGPRQTIERSDRNGFRQQAAPERNATAERPVVREQGLRAEHGAWNSQTEQPRQERPSLDQVTQTPQQDGRTFRQRMMERNAQMAHERTQTQPMRNLDNQPQIQRNPREQDEQIRRQEMQRPQVQPWRRAESGAQSGREHAQPMQRTERPVPQMQEQRFQRSEPARMERSPQQLQSGGEGRRR